MHLARIPQAEIARRLGVGEGTISRDLKALRADWARVAREDVGKPQAFFVSKPDAVGRVAKSQKRIAENANKVVAAVEAASVLRPEDRINTGKHGAQSVVPQSMTCVIKEPRLSLVLADERTKGPA